MFRAQAGTFEEKTVNGWAYDRLKTLLVGVSSSDVITTAVASISGDANIFIVRCKKRHGFDFEIKLNWRARIQLAGKEAKDINGTAKVLNACIDDYEDELAVEVEVTDKKTENAAEQAEASKQAKLLVTPLQQQLATFHKELKQR